MQQPTQKVEDDGMLAAVWEWLSAQQDLLVGLAIFSAVCFVVSLVAIPILVARIPTDYFAHDRRVPERTRHPAVHLLLVIVKNAIGVVLVLAGIVMLALPGQGMLTVLIGLLLMDFPGKYRLERRIVGQATVLKALNWIRAKAGKPPLLVDVAEQR